jgi:protein-S-isoprenylcysteine O-methyltransferase
MSLYLPQAIAYLWCGSELGLCLIKRSRADAKSKDQHSLWIILLIYAIAFTAGISAAYQLPTCRLPGPKIFRDAGVCLFFAGIVLRWCSIIYLGRFFTVNVAIAKNHRVIDSGPYRHIRHPSYTGAMLAVLGFTLTLGNWASLLTLFLPCFAAQMWRIRIEEAALLEALGEAYANYMKRTKRLIPLIY